MISSGDCKLIGLKYMLAVLLLSGSLAGTAQDMEQLFSGDRDSSGFWKRFISGEPFSIQGNYGASFRSYTASGVSNRQTPFNSTIYGNATAQVYRITIPVNFIINNLDEVSHPFSRDYFRGMLTNQRNRLSRLGISPYYKWIKVHAGHRYMSFSDYTLSNHNFLGGGVELTPGKFRFAAMAGRLAKAEPVDLALDRPNLPVYRRAGWGVKVGYGTQTDYIDLILFNAKDAPNSLGAALHPETGESVLPAENIVLGIKAQKQLIRNLSLDLEASRSGHTRNIEDPRVEGPGGGWSFDNRLFARRTSTVYGNALSANIRYKINKIQVGAGYQRIDPQFRTFGAYFFNDDLENYTCQVAGYGIRNFSFSGSFGLQRNNLDRSRAASYRRLIGSLNLNYQLNTWIMGVNYSNFQSAVNYVLSEQLDSLRVVIVTSDASVNVSKTIVGGSGTQHSIQFRAGEQAVNQNIESPTGNPATNMYYANLGYSLRLPSRWHFSANLDYNQNALSGTRQDRYGAGGKIGRSWLDNKLDMSIGTQAFRGSSPSDVRSSMQASHNLRLMWRITKLQSLQLQVNWVQNQRISGGQAERFSELIGSIGFNGQFEYKPFRKQDNRSQNIPSNE